MEEREFGRRIDHEQAVGLGNLRGDLGEMLGPRHPDRNRKAELRPNAPADRRGDLGRRAEEMRATGDVGESLVDRDSLHERREVAEDGNGRVAEALIVGEVPADEDELRAQLARPAPGHAAADPNALAS